MKQKDKNFFITFKTKKHLEQIVLGAIAKTIP